jgi:hypothetical protein
MNRYAVVALVLLVGLMGAVAPARPVAAEPGVDEGGSGTLREQLDAAAKGYLDAKAALDASAARQKQLTDELSTVEGRLGAETKAVDEIAAAAYKSGTLGPVAGVLGSGSPQMFLDRVTLLNAVASNEDEKVRRLRDSREQVSESKAAIEAEIRKQQEQVAQMAQRKEQAEKALRAAGGGQATSGFGGSSAVATPAPRNPDGTWPPEGCVLDDPTTSGCITARTLHALNQAKAAGFTRYVSCYRPSGSGEHPKGRACDFSAEAGGFGGIATGDARIYGNNLAAYFINNASRLAVLYVIWYRQIWLPGSGWRAYSGGGTPSSDHTNHVHLSVY